MFDRKKHEAALIASGKCPNHPERALVSGKQCAYCVAHTKTKVNLRKEKGMCVGHPGRYAIEGKTWCAECAENRKNRHRETKTKNKCHNHPDRDAVEDKSQCIQCISTWKNKTKIAKETGKCVVHVKRDAAPDSTMCEECLVKHKTQYHDRKQKGKCSGHPDRDAVVGKTKCEECVERSRWTRLASKYGITKETYFSMYQNQDGKCAICLEDKPAIGNGNRDVLFVDHCHKTGFVRALLCSRCNSFLGFLKEDRDTVRRVTEGMLRYIDTTIFKTKQKAVK